MVIGRKPKKIDVHCVCVCVYVCVCSNANPLLYYALRVPRKANRWRYVWSIFESRTTWADHSYVWEEYLYSVVGS